MKKPLLKFQSLLLFLHFNHLVRAAAKKKDQKSGSQCGHDVADDCRHVGAKIEDHRNNQTKINCGTKGYQKNY